MSTRRDMLCTLAGWAAAAALGRGQAAERPREILLRSSWQTVNIGDIGHTPGLLRLLEVHLPDVRVTLWPNKLDRGVREMLQAAFPRVTLAEGRLDADGKPTTDALAAAWQRADLLLHGSAPSLVARPQLEAWRGTGRPFGAYGVTLGPSIDPAEVDLLSAASFVYGRDSLSVDYLRDAGCTCPIIEFAPDATFGFHLRDDAAAQAWMAAQGLEPGRFVVAIPRLRYTPYHEIHHREPTDEDRRRAAVSAEHRGPDHEKLRAALTALLRETDLKVAACPEMIHEMQVAKEELVDAMPADLRHRIVWREAYWRPDEAASVYARAAALISFELHSPIIALAAGTPAIHLRQPTDTHKGQMWRDIGLADWLFEIDETTDDAMAATLLTVVQDREAARAKVAATMDRVADWQTRSLAVVGQAAGR